MDFAITDSGSSLCSESQKEEFMYRCTYCVDTPTTSRNMLFKRGSLPHHFLIELIRVLNYEHSTASGCSIGVWFDLIGMSEEADKLVCWNQEVWRKGYTLASSL